MSGFVNWVPSAMTFGSRPTVLPNANRIVPTAGQAAESVAAGQAAKEFMAQRMPNARVPKMPSTGRRTSYDDFGGTYGVPAGVNVPALQQQLFAPTASDI